MLADPLKFVKPTPNPNPTPNPSPNPNPNQAAASRGIKVAQGEVLALWLG